MTRTFVVVLRPSQISGEVWYGNGINRCGRSIVNELRAAVDGGRLDEFLGESGLRSEDATSLEHAVVGAECIFFVDAHMKTVEVLRDELGAD